MDDGGLFTDTGSISNPSTNRAPSITARESITIDEDSFFRMAISGDNVLKFDDDATDTEQVEVRLRLLMVASISSKTPASHSQMAKLVLAT